jgi:hypothetical protein
MNYINNTDSLTTMNTIRKNLHTDFESDLNNPNVTPEVLFSRYGTHFITSYSAGGWIETTISTVNTKQSISSDLKVAYEAAAGGSAPGASIKSAFDLEVKASGDYNTGDYQTRTFHQIVGGSGGVAFTTDPSINTTVVNN